MLRYITANNFHLFPTLRHTMFTDRAAQFRDRLKWDVTVDANNWERDAYDELGPLYVIWENPDGTHGGSMRFLPTTGQTMVQDHFAPLLGGRHVSSPHIWECTRFCLGANANAKVAGALMLAGGEVMRAFALTDLIGVFDARMVRIYQAIGASPTVLGQMGEGRDQIKVGLWRFVPTHRGQVLRRAGLSSEISEHWFKRSFGRAISERLPS